VFDAKDPVHMQFVVAAANLRAKTFSLTIPQTSRDPSYIESVLSNVIVPDFTPKSGVKIQTDPTAQTSGGMEVDENDLGEQLKQGMANLTTAASASSIPPASVMAEEFEKDDDSNHHMDFINAVGNLRARCYEIGEISKFQAKLIAGRIIPAIATTTAMATGFVCMELYKLVLDKDMESFRNTFANLALPLFAMSEPMPPKKVVSRTVKSIPDPINHPEYEEEEEIIAYPEGHTAWDKLEIRNCGSMTLGELRKHFTDQHKIELSSMAVESTEGKGLMVYNALMPKTKANVDLTIAAIVDKYCGTDSKAMNYFVPAILFENEDGDSVETPEVVLWLWK